VFDALRRRNLALCIADSEKMSHAGGADRGLRLLPLRDEGYQAADIEAWAATIRDLDGIRDA
jgi:hypothetical protein